MGLESEHQFHPKGNKTALIANLRENGASEDEIAYMFADFDRLRSTRRVELNSMTSPQFLAFLERKLKDANIAKIVPEQDFLAEVYAGLERGRRLQETLDDLHQKIAKDVKVPKDLPERVRKFLKKNPALRWDTALAELIGRSGRGAS